MLELRFVDAENRDFHDLTAKLDEYYFMLVGEVEKRYAKYNLPHLFNCRIVAYEDGKPAGCGAWKKIDEGTFEVKRIYIAPEFRRKGVASAVIAALEQDAAKHGFTKAILETARTTEDSAALYTKLGYRVIPYYGSPAGAENCLCFEKNLGGSEGRDAFNNLYECILSKDTGTERFNDAYRDAADVLRSMGGSYANVTRYPFSETAMQVDVLLSMIADCPEYKN